MEISLSTGRRRLLRPVEAFEILHDTRPFVRLVISDAGGLRTGEVSPLEVAVHGDPDVHGVLEELRTKAIPMLLGIVDREGQLPEWSRVSHFLTTRPENRWAWACIEMGLLDNKMSELSLPADAPRQSLRTFSVNAETLSIDPQQERVRLKLDAETPPDRLTRTLDGYTGEVILDYNASLVTESMAQLHFEVTSETAVVVALEQPCAVGDFDRPAALSRDLSLPISLDESIRSLADVRLAAKYDACTLVCIKPSRVGGIAAARSMALECERLGLRYYFGSFFDGLASRQWVQYLAASTRAEHSDYRAVDFAPGEQEEVVDRWTLASNKVEL
jgi:hypothetical protein